MIEECFSLLSRPWIPVRRADGARVKIRPAEITSLLDSNPVLAPAWGRPDFDAATREFLIGLLAVACARQASEDDWDAWFDAPPTSAALEPLFAGVEHAFQLDGEGPRFGQVPDLGNIHDEEPVPISDLWLDSQSAYFNKGRGEIILSRAGAAITLFTMQTYAPEGGRGHYTSVRGGGPLTTLIIPGGNHNTLWHTLWLNVSSTDRPASLGNRLARIFPWLDPPEEGKGQYDPDRGDALQAFWGLPRRIVLDFEPNRDKRSCVLTGDVDEIIVRTFRRRPNGIQYEGKLIHPLSPMRRTKPTELFRAFRTPPGGVGYRHWVGLVAPSEANDATSMAKPAVSTVIAQHRSSDLNLRIRLRSSGYETKQNKALAFVESEFPVFLVKGHARAYEAVIRRFVRGATETVKTLRLAVRNALFVKKTQADKGFQKAVKEGGALDLAEDRFWDCTEADFLERIGSLAHAMQAPDANALKIANDTAEAWRDFLSRIALEIFDELVSFHDLDALNTHAARARIEARNDLRVALLGYGPLGANLFKALDLAAPETKAKKRAGKAREAAK